MSTFQVQQTFGTTFLLVLMCISCPWAHNLCSLVLSCCWPLEEPDEDLNENARLLPGHNLPPYTYQSLATDEIRLLVLHPAKSFEDDIVIHLQTLKRSDAKNYQAVSYVWGNNSNTVPLLVHDEQSATSYLHNQAAWTRIYRYNYANQQNFQMSLRVRANVATMLRYFRYPWLPRYLWIDQLCINQNDNNEKNHQVNQMGEIYKNSTKTLIWLGCSTSFARPLSALEAAARKSHQTGRQIANGDHEEELEENGMLYTRLKPEVRYLLSLPWFQRRWIIQEAALAPRPRVVFGHDEMLFEDMTYFIDQVRKRSYDIPPNISESIRMLDTMTSVFRRSRFHGAGLITNIKHIVYDQYYLHHPKSNDAVDFIQLLVSMHSAQCSDARDRLYALNNLRRDPMKVDYKKTTEDVFTTFAEAECTLSLETLYCSGAFPSQNLPSWVPDWRSPRQWIPIKSFEGRHPSYPLLSESPRRPNSSSQKPIFKMPKIMVVNAITFTFVASKGPLLFDNWSFNPWLCLSKYLKFYERTNNAGVYRENDVGVQSLGRLVSTLTAGAIQSGENLSQWLDDYDSSQSYKRARKAYLDACCDCKDKSFCPFPTTHSNNYNILARIEAILQGRSTFVTDNGYWAVGPASLLSGDFIVLLPGCSYPFVMRQKGPAMFTIVGDCYISIPGGLDTVFNQSLSRTISII